MSYSMSHYFELCKSYFLRFEQKFWSNSDSPIHEHANSWPHTHTHTIRSDHKECHTEATFTWKLMLVSSLFSEMSYWDFCWRKVALGGALGDGKKKHDYEGITVSTAETHTLIIYILRLTFLMGHMHLRFRHTRFRASGLVNPCLQLAHWPQLMELWQPTHWPQGIHYRERLCWHTV